MNQVGDRRKCKMIIVRLSKLLLKKVCSWMHAAPT